MRHCSCLLAALLVTFSLVTYNRPCFGRIALGYKNHQRGTASWRAVRTLKTIPMLRLRGGNGTKIKAVSEADAEQLLHENLPEYKGQEGWFENQTAKNTVDPKWLTQAQEAVRIKMVLGDSAEKTWRGDPFPPLYAHQVFGPDEAIVGYQSPRVEISYAADSLVASISFSHSGAARKGEVKRTDVIDCIKRNVPSDYINATRLPSFVKMTRGAFEPPGNMVHDYTDFDLGRDEAYLKRTREECGGSSVRYQAFHWKGVGNVTDGNEDDDLEKQNELDLVKRAQSLAIWFIERSSYIDMTDPSWSCIFLYERVDGALKNNTLSSMPVFHLIGFVTLYRKSIDGMTAKELAEITPLRKDIQGKTGLARLFISQFLVLPPYKRRGHGAQLLKLVYKLARRDPTVLDVAVEDPNDAFKALRTKCDAGELREMSLLEALRSAEPPWGKIQNKTKLSMVQLFALAEVVGSEAGRAGVRPPEPEQKYPSLFGVPIDLQFVYDRSKVLGFTPTEIDDILHAIRAEDLEGVTDPQDGASRLLSGVYLAVVADLAQAEGLPDEQVRVCGCVCVCVCVSVCDLST
jgi:hypothetical protein